MSLIYEGRGRESVVGVEWLASSWTMWSSKPDGKRRFRFSTHIQTSPGARPASSIVGTGDKAAGVNHSPPSSATVQLDLCSPLTSQYLTGWPLLYL
jgi:hypothetical protein